MMQHEWRWHAARHLSWMGMRHWPTTCRLRHWRNLVSSRPIFTGNPALCHTETMLSALIAAAALAATASAGAACCAYGGSGSMISLAQGALSIPGLGFDATLLVPAILGTNAGADQPFVAVLIGELQAHSAWRFAVRRARRTAISAHHPRIIRPPAADPRSGPEDAIAGWTIVQTSPAEQTLTLWYNNTQDRVPVCATQTAPTGSFVTSFEFCGGGGASSPRCLCACVLAGSGVCCKLSALVCCCINQPLCAASSAYLPSCLQSSSPTSTWPTTLAPSPSTAGTRPRTSPPRGSRTRRSGANPPRCRGSLARWVAAHSSSTSSTAAATRRPPSGPCHPPAATCKRDCRAASGQATHRVQPHSRHHTQAAHHRCDGVEHGRESAVRGVPALPLSLPVTGSQCAVANSAIGRVPRPSTCPAPYVIILPTIGCREIVAPTCGSK